MYCLIIAEYDPTRTWVCNVAGRPCLVEGGQHFATVVLCQQERFTEHLRCFRLCS